MFVVLRVSLSMDLAEVQCIISIWNECPHPKFAHSFPIYNDSSSWNHYCNYNLWIDRFCCEKAMALSIKSLNLNLPLERTRIDGGPLLHPSNPVSTSSHPIGQDRGKQKWAKTFFRFRRFTISHSTAMVHVLLDLLSSVAHKQEFLSHMLLLYIIY